MLVGCQDQPRPGPGLSAAAVRVIARPKAGVARTFERVPVYDAARNWCCARAARAGRLLASVGHHRVAGSFQSTTDSHRRQARFDIDPAKPSSIIRPASVSQTIVIRNTSTRPLALYSVSEGNEFEMQPLAAGASRRSR